MLLYADRISPYLLLIPVIAFVQYVFTLGVSFLVSAINVFFRDLGNVLRHVLRLWFYLSPALYSMAVLDASATFQQQPAAAHRSPMRTPSRSCSSRTAPSSTASPRGRHMRPTGWPCSACWRASVVLLAFGAIVFKRLEPTFAKVL